MKIIIDTDKKTVEVPSGTKRSLEERNKLNRDMGRKEETILSLLDIDGYQVISKQVQSVKDTTNSKTIDEYMESIKDEKRNLYDEYQGLKKQVVKHTKDGKPVYTSFLTIKAWYYKNFPNQRPRKK